LETISLIDHIVPEWVYRGDGRPAAIENAPHAAVGFARGADATQAMTRRVGAEILAANQIAVHEDGMEGFERALGADMAGVGMMMMMMMMMLEGMARMHPWKMGAHTPNHTHTPNQVGLAGTRSEIT
jgi:hypothetical protein